jgi:hypothetical protein
VVPNSGAGAGEWRSFEERADAMPGAAPGEKSVSVRGLPGGVALAAPEAGGKKASLTADWHAPTQARSRLEWATRRLPLVEELVNISPVPVSRLPDLRVSLPSVHLVWTGEWGDRRNVHLFPTFIKNGNIPSVPGSG